MNFHSNYDIGNRDSTVPTTANTHAASITPSTRSNSMVMIHIDSVPKPVPVPEVVHNAPDKIGKAIEDPEKNKARVADFLKSMIKGIGSVSKWAGTVIKMGFGGLIKGIGIASTLTAIAISAAIGFPFAFFTHSKEIGTTAGAISYFALGYIPLLIIRAGDALLGNKEVSDRRILNILDVHDFFS